MATKKQKREAAEAKRREFMEQVKTQGLAAQKADQEQQKMDVEAIAAKINARYAAILSGEK